MKFYMLVVCIVLSMHAKACDICGGVNPNTSIGVLASSNFHLISLRTNYRLYSSFQDGIHHSNEHIISTELNFRFQLFNRLQIMGSLPFQFAYQVRDLGMDQKMGLGDPSFLFNGILMNKKDSTGNSIHFLSFGGGLKMPFGVYPGNETMIRNLYPGTGSTDFLLLTNYTCRLKNGVGWQSELSYNIKGANPLGYQYGNSFQFNTQLVHNRKWNGKRLIASYGLCFDRYEKARSRLEELDLTQDGYALSFKTSLNLMSKRFMYSISVQPVLIQNLNQGSTKQRITASLGINYLIQKN